MSIQIYSFDVFDTCITRPYVKPTDLFRELAQRTLAETGLAITQDNIDQIQHLRISAESQARRHHAELEDVSLDQIYQSLAAMATLPIDPQCMKSSEIALELECCTPIQEVLQQVRAARQRGRIVYISDMYLGQSTIQGMLEKCGFWEEGDSLYVSNNVGRSKHRGSLFHHVAQAEGVNAQQIHHTGDNKRADVRMARAAGASATYFGNGQLTYYEKEALSGCSNNAAQNFIGLNKSIRLRSSEAGDPRLAPPASVVHSVIAPFLVVFVAWVLEQARKDGKQRLYFVSRDAEIFYKIARILVAKDNDIECRYLYGSRKAWFAPSLLKCDRQEMKWAYESIMDRTPRAILRRLDLDPAEFLERLTRFGFSNLDEALDDARTERFVTALEDDELREAVLKGAAVSRSHVLGYLEQEGLLEPTPWSIVDIGWVLNCQNSLRRIIKSANPSIETHGYYLGVARKHVPPRECGSFSSYFSHSTSKVSGEHTEDWIFHIPSLLLLEHLFTPATHGTVMGYALNASWIPLKAEVDPLSEFQHWVGEFHRMVEEHATAFADSNLTREPLSELMPVANRLLYTFLTQPQKEDVAAIAWLKTNAEQSHYKEYERRLASPLSMRDMLGIILFELNPASKRYAHPSHSWLNGSAALSGPLVKYTYYVAKRINQFLGAIKRRA